MQFLKFILSTHCVYLTINGSAIGSSGDDALLSIKKMSNQRFVVSGGTNTAAGYKHNLLMILNSQLNVMNSAAINFPFKTLILRNAVENSDGSITAFNYDYLAGNTDMGLVKFDSMLNMTWAKWYGDNALNKTLHGLIKDGNIYSIGMGEGFGFVDINIIMVQTDLNGNTVNNAIRQIPFLLNIPIHIVLSVIHPQSLLCFCILRLRHLP
ncbi:MAG: hypothetical protein IPO27_14700 [Bacteroidetes bacterium]|nr:hypothetical protein [Bacteroidota bacterium]